MMLTYPPFMQRHPHFAAAAMPGSYGPQALPAFPQFTSAAITSPPMMPVAAFALQAQIPSPVRLSSPPANRADSPAESKKDSSSAAAVQQQGSGSKCSFSIESILSRGDDRTTKNKDVAPARREQPAATTSSLSPATPLSAGQKPNGFYYFYPPQAAPTFPFSPQSCLESELHRSAALHGRLTAPVAVISEIVRNAAGNLVTMIMS